MNVSLNAIKESFQTLREVYIMSICKNCGTDFNGQFCPNCGSPSADAPVDLNKDQNAAPNYGANQGYNVPQAYNPPPIYPGNFTQQPAPTSAWGWFGWMILLGCLPIIGHIIMLLCANDPSAKNFAKMQVTLMCVAVVIALVIVLLAVVLPILGVAVLD